MRVLVFVGFVGCLSALFIWQAPESMPGFLVSLIETASAQSFVTTCQAMIASLGGGPSVLPYWAAIGAGVVLVGVVGGAYWFRSRSLQPEPKEPDWLGTARLFADEARSARDYLHQCDLIGQKLVPDVAYRGRAALARAHQLDLYWRFVGTNKTTKNGRPEGYEYKRWVATTREALRAVAVTPEGRFMPTFYDFKPALALVGGEPAKKMRGFYGALAKKFADYDAAWMRAHGELCRGHVNRDRVLTAMEDLRRLNRDIAAEAADLVGPIAIDVRAVN